MASKRTVATNRCRPLSRRRRCRRQVCPSSSALGARGLQLLLHLAHESDRESIAVVARAFLLPLYVVVIVLDRAPWGPNNGRRFLLSTREPTNERGNNKLRSLAQSVARSMDNSGQVGPRERDRERSHQLLG